MATADYWSEADLKALTYGGLVNEDVMQKIWNISQIPLPLTDALGYGENITATPYGWTQDSQATPDLTNAAVDGADAATNKAAGGTRVQNHAQICEKLVEVTERAQAVDTIGRANEYAYQIAMRQRDNRRDIEAIAMNPQASVADNGNATAGKVGTLDAWLTSNTSNGATGSDGGFQTGTGLVTAPTSGTKRALSVATFRSIIESVYGNNGNITVAMSRPGIISRLNNYILANPTTFAIAQPTANVGGGDPTAQVAQGYVNVLITDFGTTLDLVPNRLYQYYATDKCSMLLIDTGMAEFANLIGEHTEPLAKQGTADRSQISQQWGFRVMDEKAHGSIRDIDDTAAVTA